MLRNAPNLAALRAQLRAATLADETETIRALIAEADLTVDARARISAAAAELVRTVRTRSRPTAMESFLGEYGLSTEEGVALMCLAEALLRVPDTETIDALIEDKITPGDWGRHLGRSSSVLVNASSWALLLTGRVLAEPPKEAARNLVGALRGAVKRLGEPVIRVAVAQAMKELGRQFVLGRDIGEAMNRAATLEKKGYAYSYDMLGEAARTDADAERYFEAYQGALARVADAATSDDIRENPGLSVKLSALHPRYEFAQRARAVPVLIDRLRALARAAAASGVGLNVDAEEADRLDLSLDVIGPVLEDPALAGWHGFGVVVQAYGQRAGPMIDWLAAQAETLDRRLMVRLVKGAYWDTEIKRAQTLGLDGYPVFTRKPNTDVSYIGCAAKLLRAADRLYPQFATHNAHTAAAILDMAEATAPTAAYEFQRLHGMGEALYTALREPGANSGKPPPRCRIYAPVGAHRDLLAYLVRRLLENGANSSFVNQIVDESIPPEEIARDPLTVVASFGDALANPKIARPDAIFGADRRNARGWDLTDPDAVAALEAARAPFQAPHQWRFDLGLHGPERRSENPARPADVVGALRDASPDDVAAAFETARAAQPGWEALGAAARGQALRAAADLYERHAPELFALAAREAGKTLLDGVAEVREAVDFLRFYAGEAERLAAVGRARGVVACISPWNFPLAIFTGQIAAALAAGCSVLAKPAEQTPLMAARAVALLHAAGAPVDVLQLLPGAGDTVGRALTADPRVDGVVFTGSTETAARIHRTLAEHAPNAMFIAETGGVNAMIVDSTALPEQAVRDILASAFQSAGQRCSALRVLYVQRDVADDVLAMLTGAMDALTVGDPWALETDVGPVIDADAQAMIAAHCAALEAKGAVVKRLTAAAAPTDGRFAPPALFRVSGVEALEREVFGPVLHVATFEAEALDQVIDAVNGSGYGLTLGLHTRIDDRVQQVVDRAEVGNLYVNRNQIGAVVGSQPFGGEGLSGTGPKAGGPLYLRRFIVAQAPEPAEAPLRQAPTTAPLSLSDVADALATLEESDAAAAWAQREDRAAAFRGETWPAGAQAALEAAAALSLGPLDLPGPTGESNRWRALARGAILCLGPGRETALAQALQAVVLGGRALLIGPGAAADAAWLAALGAPAAGLESDGGEAALDPDFLKELTDVAGVAFAGSAEAARPLRLALAARSGPIAPFIVDPIAPEAFLLERAVCIDTTAAGGNASLLAAS